MARVALSPQAIRASIAAGALYTYLRPRMAQDEKVDTRDLLLPLRGGRTFRQAKDEIADRVRAATKDRLAQDADIDDVANLLDAVENMIDGAPEASIPEGLGEEDDDLEFRDVDRDGEEELVRDDEPDPMIARIREFLKSIGLGDDVMEQFDQLVASEAEPEDVTGGEPPDDNADLDDDVDVDIDNDNDEDDEMNRDRRPRGMDNRRRAHDTRRGQDTRRARDTRRGMDNAKPPTTGITRPAMDAAIKTATDAAVRRERENQRAIYEACRLVRPLVGELNMAFDSADEVYGAALKSLGYETKDVPPAAYRAMLDVHIKNRQQQARGPRMAQDTLPNGVKSFAERFPGAARIGRM